MHDVGRDKSRNTSGTCTLPSGQFPALRGITNMKFTFLLEAFLLILLRACWSAMVERDREEDSDGEGEESHSYSHMVIYH